MNFEKIENEELRAELEAQFKEAIESAKETAHNDADFVKGVKLNAFKESERKFTKLLKKSFGLDTTDLEGAESLDDYMKLGLQKIEKDSTATGQEWQDKYLSLKEDYTKVQEETIPALKEKLPTCYTSWCETIPS